MRAKSAKAKGRRLQDKVVRDLQEAFSLNDDDIRPAIMGEKGIDIKLMSDRSRRAVGLAIECKNTEKLNIWDALKQAAENAGQTMEAPAVVFTRNRSKTYVVIEWEKLIELLMSQTCSTPASSAQS